MSKSLVTIEHAVEPPIFDDGQIELIKNTVAKGATDDELKTFLHHCKKTGLDPLAKQIYFQKRHNQKTGKSIMTIIIAIDGYRLIAHRTGQYAGADPTIFDNEENPGKATVTVYKLLSGMRCPFTASARWDQYYPGDSLGFMWKKMPHLMLEKCAESLALRKAFPAELSGTYTEEEMQQAGEALPIPPPAVILPTVKPPEDPDEKPEIISREEAIAMDKLAEELGWSQPERDALKLKYGIEFIGHLPKEKLPEFEAELRGA